MIILGIIGFINLVLAILILLKLNNQEIFEEIKFIKELLVIKLPSKEPSTGSPFRDEAEKIEEPIAKTVKQQPKVEQGLDYSRDTIQWEPHGNCPACNATFISLNPIFAGVVDGVNTFNVKCNNCKLEYKAWSKPSVNSNTIKISYTSK